MINILKVVKVEMRKPDFDPNPQKSTTDNHEWRQGLIVTLKDARTGTEYLYMPKWADLEAINSMKSVVEDANKQLCAYYNERVSASAIRKKTYKVKKDV